MISGKMLSPLPPDLTHCRLQLVIYFGHALQPQRRTPARGEGPRCKQELYVQKGAGLYLAGNSPGSGGTLKPPLPSWGQEFHLNSS